MRFARLTDRDDQVAFADDRVATSELARELGDGGYLCELFDPVTARDRRVMAGAAGEQDHPSNALGVLVAQADLGRRDVGVLAVEPAAQGVFERAGLLEDLLEHEVLVAILLGHHRRPGDASWPPAHFGAVELGQRETLRFEHGNFTVLHEHHLVRVRKQRRNVAGAIGCAMRTPRSREGLRSWRPRCGPAPSPREQRCA